MNINLNQRLKRIAEIVGSTSAIIDVGTDHGQLPVYLVQKGCIDRCIVSDISKPSLQKAIILAKKEHLSDRIEARAGSGFSVLRDSDDIEAGVVAGMGGNLISELIEESFEILLKKKMRLLLQPMQNPEVLRAYLIEHNLRIRKEALVKEEDHHIYQIIVTRVEDGEASNQEYSWVELMFGKRSLYESVDLPLRSELIQKYIARLKRVMEQVNHSSAGDKSQILGQCENQIKELKEEICV